jgi:hypothetical protein
MAKKEKDTRTTASGSPVADNQNSLTAVNYEPNSFNGLVEDPSVKEPPLKISGDVDPTVTASATTTTRRRGISSV